jgi:hypothetical protein
MTGRPLRRGSRCCSIAAKNASMSTCSTARSLWDVGSSPAGAWDASAWGSVDGRDDDGAGHDEACGGVGAMASPGHRRARRGGGVGDADESAGRTRVTRAGRIRPSPQMSAPDAGPPVSWTACTAGHAGADAHRWIASVVSRSVRRMPHDAGASMRGAHAVAPRARPPACSTAARSPRATGAVGSCPGGPTRPAWIRRRGRTSGWDGSPV